MSKRPPQLALSTDTPALSLLKSSSSANLKNEQGADIQHVRVMTRVRPFSKQEKEKSESEKKELKPCILMRDGANGAQCCVIVDPETGNEREAFEFDECFWTLPLEECDTEKPFADQKYLYDRSGLLALQAAFQGYNCCIFAYGQTGSGKTYTMLGPPNQPGISPQLCDDLFAEIAKLSTTTPTTKIEIDCTFMEIYNEKVRDLFNKRIRDSFMIQNNESEYEPAKVRLHPQKGVYVEGLSRKTASTTAEAKFFIEHGAKERAMAETKMNATSSRSHAIFQIHMTQKNVLDGTVRTSTINLVDLAGSERVKHSGVTGDALKEAQNINQSLSTLRRVIDTLIDNSKLKPNSLTSPTSPRSPSTQRRLPPFRESVLTWVLSDSLGGNSKTMMMTAISPHIVNVEETISTLRYALRAKAIVCSAKVNEEKSSVLVASLRDEIRNLQAQLESGSMSPRSGGGIRKEIEWREAEMIQLEGSFKKKEEEMTKQLDMHLEQSESLKAANMKLVKQVEDLQMQNRRLEEELTAWREGTIRDSNNRHSAGQKISAVEKAATGKTAAEGKQMGFVLSTVVEKKRCC